MINELQQEETMSKAVDLKVLGMYKEAIKLCEGVLCSNLACEEAYEEIGDCYLFMRDYEKAERALEKALELDTHSPNAHYLMGFLLQKMGKWDKAVEHCMIANSLQPNHPEILRCLGYNMFYRDFVDGVAVSVGHEGIILLYRAGVLAPDDTDILADLGMCLASVGKWDESLEQLRRWELLEPECAEVKDYIQMVLDSKRVCDGLKTVSGVRDN